MRDFEKTVAKQLLSGELTATLPLTVTPYDHKMFASPQPDIGYALRDSTLNKKLLVLGTQAECETLRLRYLAAYTTVGHPPNYEDYDYKDEKK